MGRHVDHRVDGPADCLNAAEAALTRFRTGLEGSRAYTPGGRVSLTPSVEVGLRHDGGDAETGASFAFRPESSEGPPSARRQPDRDLEEHHVEASDEH